LRCYVPSVSNAFDTDNVPAQDTRAESEGWARRIALGEKLGV
jgi:hypothetical protein